MKILFAALALSLVGFGCAAGTVDSSDSTPAASDPNGAAPPAEHPENGFNCSTPYANCADYCGCDFQECIAEGNPRLYCGNEQRVCMNTCPH